ncbi:MAG: Mur ligase family protein [Bacillota bacterium]|nr:Mur ligase family protein [Bacillota bacterium]
MTYREVLACLENSRRFGSRLGLERIRGLCAGLGNPQNRYPAIHVAGTNGKGSTCAMIAGMLAASGRRVGMFTSPYLVRFTDHIHVFDGPGDLERRLTDPSCGEITETELAAIFGEVHAVDRARQEAGAEAATEFELITATALEHFARRRCDVVVLEVGLGGDFDSTNVIPAPRVAVITALGYDHQDRLGPTMYDIARSKAGIIKPGTGRVILYDPSQAAATAGDAFAIYDTVATSAARLDVPLDVVDRGQIRELDAGPGGQRFMLRGQAEAFEMRLVGESQLLNAAVAIRAALAFDPTLSHQPALREGLRLVSWPGRFELVAREPDTILDGAHNPQAIRALLANCLKFLGGRPLVVVNGVLGDKDSRDMARLFYGDGRLDLRAVIATQPANSRALPAARLVDTIRAALPAAAARIAVEEQPDSGAALRRARELAAAIGEEAAVLCMGSLYLVRELHPLLQEPGHALA